MSVPKRVGTLGILVSMAALLGLPAMAQNASGTASVAPAATTPAATTPAATTPAATAPVAAPGTTAPLPGPGTIPAGVAPAGAPAAPAALTHESQLAPGHLLEPRRMLFQRLMQAREEGIGTGPYMAAFGRLEDSVRNGSTPEMLQPQIESLARSLKSQIDRSRMLKTQRPIPTQPAQEPAQIVIPPGGGAGPTSGPSTLGGGKLDGLLEKVKERLQNGDIPDSLKDKLNSDKGRKLLEKLGQ